jgi:hypothetical protein
MSTSDFCNLVVVFVVVIDSCIDTFCYAHIACLTSFNDQSTSVWVNTGLYILHVFVPTFRPAILCYTMLCDLLITGLRDMREWVDLNLNFSMHPFPPPIPRLIVGGAPHPATLVHCTALPRVQDLIMLMHPFPPPIPRLVVGGALHPATLAHCSAPHCTALGALPAEILPTSQVQECTVGVLPTDLSL